MASDLGVLVPLPAVLWPVIDDFGFLSIIDASSFDPMLFYIACYQTDEIEWLFLDLADRFLLYDFAPGRVNPLAQEVISGREHALGHRFSTSSLDRCPLETAKGHV